MLSFSFNFIFCFSPEANSPTATQRYKWRTNSTEKKVISGCHHSSVDLSSPSILPPQVRVPSTPSTLFSIYIVQIVYLSFELECEKYENKQKEAGIGPFFKKNTNVRWVITTYLTYLFSLDSAALLSLNQHQLYLLGWIQEVSHTMILPPTVSVLSSNRLFLVDG